MPKIVDYPRATLAASINLAQAVDTLGGSCSKELAADKLGKKVSGAFAALMATTSRFGFITIKKGQLSVTPTYRDYKLAYDDQERTKVLRSAFLSIPLFERIVKRFDGMPLPSGHFEKMLVKEFDVPENIGSRVAKYFIDGAKQAGILDENDVVAFEVAATTDDSSDEAINSDVGLSVDKESVNIGLTRRVEGVKNIPVSEASDSYSVRITGPSVDMVIQINEADDLLIVDALLAKVRKKMNDEENRKPLDD